MGIHVTDADIYHNATKLAEQHGQDAATVADMRAEQLRFQGNMDGYRMWKRIVLVVDELLASGPAEGEMFH